MSTSTNDSIAEYETDDSRISKRNKEVYGIAYLFVFAFLAMTAYLIWFMIERGDAIQNNIYNARVEHMSVSTIRGDIISSDGTVLAHTEVSNDGTEQRVYPLGDQSAHIVGYMINGGLGVERNYSYYLLNSHLGVQSMLNSELTGEKQIGDNLYMTIDAHLQQTAYDALGDYQGAIVALEPSTGKVLAMVSKPDFDPNTLAEQWSEITAEGSNDSSLYNRATLGQYPPGSTFKVLTTLAYYRAHTSDFNDDIIYQCNGVYHTEYGDIHCSNWQAHGDMRLSNGLAMSCNGIFAMIGQELDGDGLNSLCKDFLFNTKITENFDVNTSSFSLTAESDSWMKMQTAIGQGQTLFSPLHGALIAATIANRGVMQEPYIVDHVENANGLLVEQFEGNTLGTPMTEHEATWMSAMMVNVMKYGTGQAAWSEEYEIAGKTGSAQYDSSENTHALFIGFAPADDPKIAVCVVVEQGGSGGNVAAPMAKQLFDAYLLQNTPSEAERE